MTEITGLSDIDDESDGDLIDATSGGSATPESVASDMDGSESGGHGASLLASGSTLNAQEYMAPVQARLEHLDLTQERVAHLSGSKDACIRAGKVVQRSKELDYALIEVDPAVGSLCDVGHNIIDLDDGSRVEKDPRDAAVKTTTPGGGTVGGILSGTPSLVRLPHSKTYTEVYLARFDQPLVEGDCGSWVRDAITGNLFGHIFAGSPTSGLTMVMPACSVFEQIRSCVQDRLESFEAKSVGIAVGNAERHEDEDGQPSGFASLSNSHSFASPSTSWIFDGKFIQINVKFRNGEEIPCLAKCCLDRRYSLADIGIVQHMPLKPHPIHPQRRMNQTIEKAPKSFCVFDIAEVENIGRIDLQLFIQLGRLSDQSVSIELGYEALAQLGCISVVGHTQGKSYYLAR